MQTIFFIRHGETTCDVENRYGGSYDDHLTEQGRREARALAEKLENKQIEVIICSPLLRSRETAEILNEALRVPVSVMNDLREGNWHGPVLSGMNKDEAKENYPELVEMHRDWHDTLPGAESYEDFVSRTTKIFETITEDASHSCVAVVAHGGAMKVLFREILKKGEITYGNCSFVVLHCADGHLTVSGCDGIQCLQ